MHIRVLLHIEHPGGGRGGGVACDHDGEEAARLQILPELLSQYVLNLIYPINVVLLAEGGGRPRKQQIFQVRHTPLVDARHHVLAVVQGNAH